MIIMKRSSIQKLLDLSLTVLIQDEKRGVVCFPEMGNYTPPTLFSRVRSLDRDIFTVTILVQLFSPNVETPTSTKNMKKEKFANDVVAVYRDAGYSGSRGHQDTDLGLNHQIC